MARANRYDTHRLDAVEELPSGALRVPARFARVGVLTYRDGDGNAWGELVTPEALFDAASMATARGIALTDLHPGALVSPATRREVSVGHVGDTIARDGAYLSGAVYVTDPEAIARVRAGERKDVSCGYTCDFDEAPGVLDGVPYTRVQKSRVYNHLGIGPEGWGRAGTDVSLRLDGAAEATGRFDAPVARLDSQTSQTTGARAAPNGDDVKKVIKVRGVEYKIDADDDIATAQAAVDVVEKKADADLGELAAIKTALTDALKLVATLEAKLVVAGATNPAPVTEEMVPEAVADSIASKRVALRDGARLVLPATVKLDGITGASAIRREVIKHQFPTVRLDGMTVATEETLFNAAVDAAKGAQQKRADGDARIAAVLVTTPEQAAEQARQDAAAESDDPVMQQRKALSAWGKAPLGTNPRAAGKA